MFVGLLFFFHIILLFIFGCAGSSLLHVGFSLVVVSRGCSLAAVCGFLLLWSVGSRAHRLDCCGVQDWLLSGTWDLPRSGVEFISSALAGVFFTAEPPGKPINRFSTMIPHFFFLNFDRLLLEKFPQNVNFYQQYLLSTVLDCITCSFLKIILLKDNCFTEFCFLSNLNMHQP